MLAFPGGSIHGLGLHVPAGALKLPAKQLIWREAEAVYPLLHVGVHEEPLGVSGSQGE